MKNRGGWMGKLVGGQAVLVGLLSTAVTGWAQVVTTTVQGTVYRADGTPAQGTMLVSWPAFVTANKQAVAAGSTTVLVGADGFASLNLAPNTGASPAGSYYTVVYHLASETSSEASGGSTSSTGSTVSKEYWTVPAAATASIASVRAQLEPSMVAVQSVSKSYVDNLVSTLAPTAQNYVPLVGGAMTGPLTLSADPASATQASTKHYVDAAVATAVPIAGGVVTGTLAMANTISKLPKVDVRSADFAGGADPSGARDSTAAVQAAIAFAMSTAPLSQGNLPVVYLPAGHYRINGTLRIPSMLLMEGDSKEGTVLQETNATASLVTVGSVTGAAGCTTYACYGGLQDLTLEGAGKATTGSLLEMNTGAFNLRNVHFYNNGGRGLQMNAASERVVSYDLSFYQVRWPIILSGDSNEDYFYNTHIIEAGQTSDGASNTPLVSHYCYSVNCTNGVYALPGTTASPTVIYPDPHGSIDIDKAVNVSFIGGSVKSSYMLSGVKVWSGTVIRFQNFYHEGVYYAGLVPSMNRAYMIGGVGEQTYLTGALSGSGVSASVHDVSWMPQFFGLTSDLSLNDGNYYPYVLLPQDYNRASTASSAYVSGLQQNQYEIVNVEGSRRTGCCISSRTDGMREARRRRGRSGRRARWCRSTRAETLQ